MNYSLARQFSLIRERLCWPACRFLLKKAAGSTLEANALRNRRPRPHIAVYVRSLSLKNTKNCLVDAGKMIQLAACQIEKSNNNSAIRHDHLSGRP
jgi:hypothetical protein